MIRKLLGTFVALALIFVCTVFGLFWFTFRIEVGENQCAVLIRKTGDALPEGRKVAVTSNEKGIQEQVLGPGRYFYNPYTWNWELVELTVVPSGRPQTWQWARSRSTNRHETPRTHDFEFKGEFPMIGVVTRKVGKVPTGGRMTVPRDSGEEGILQEVLTPGVYKLNPYIYSVELAPATVIPAGFVGVVTNMFGGASADAAVGAEFSAVSRPEDSQIRARPLARAGERGTLEDVLQPGVYFINPKLQKVTRIEIGFNEYSQLKVNEEQNYRISFPSDTGYLIRVGVTVVWGIHPKHAAQIINEFGNVDLVLEKVINPQLRSICRNVGSTYSARDFIQGEKRELFQKQMTEELQHVCRAKNIEILLALVREIEVNAPSTAAGKSDVTEDLKRTIQQSYIAIENQLTKDKQKEAATRKAKLEEAKKKVDIAREMIHAETGVKVANIRAEGEKQAAEISAQADLEVATIQQEVAHLDAKRTEILGRAKADVERMKNAAEAEGYRLLVEAFGSPKAYNLYTFAEGFQPESIRLFFAGEGTFWTDLTRFEQVGAAKMLQTSGDQK